MLKWFIDNKHQVVLWILIFSYIAYFSVFSTLRYKHLYAEYFDLGIMHQTVYNTYQGIKTGDFARILELTAPYAAGEQIKRMAIHNDPLLALLAPFYFVYSGPETLLILQTLVLALGAWAVFKLSQLLLKQDLLSLIFSFVYLMYFPMQRANIFEFHAVTFATSFILFFFYFWQTKKFKLSFIFLILALLTKEEVGLSLGMFGVYETYKFFRYKRDKPLTVKPAVLSLSIIFLCWSWALFSTYWIIPHFRGEQHFASGYFNDAFANPAKYLLTKSTFIYLINIFGPISFLTLLQPFYILIALPELAINLLSSNFQLRDLNFQYLSVIQPWLFIGAIFGYKKIKDLNLNKLSGILNLTIILFSLFFSYLKSPLPYSQEKNIDPWIYSHENEYLFVKKWQTKLADDKLKVASTDQIAPHLASRRYFYIFSPNYKRADYVVLSLANLQFTYRPEAKLAYEELKRDKSFLKIDADEGIEVYKKRD